MDTRARAIMRRVVDRLDTTGDMARLPAVYRDTGGGFMSGIAVAAILRLALRWPVLSVAVILATVAARFWSGRLRRAPNRPNSAAVR